MNENEKEHEQQLDDPVSELNRKIEEHFKRLGKLPKDDTLNNADNNM